MTASGKHAFQPLRSAVAHTEGGAQGARPPPSGPPRKYHFQKDVEFHFEMTPLNPPPPHELRKSQI